MPTTKQQDAIALLKADHDTVEDLFTKFEAAGDRAHKTKRDLMDRIVRELSIHAAVEELVFYPAVRAMADRAGNDEIPDTVLEGLEEHGVAKWLLSELESMSPEHERFQAKAMVLIENVRHHVEEEEQELFPEVRKLADRSTLVELGELLATAKKTAPTHPHPRSPDTPPANLANLVTGLLDRLRDSARDAVKAAAR
jgi:hemerythrin superfamily protein